MTFPIPDITDRLFEIVWCVKVTVSYTRPPTPDTYENVYVWLQFPDDGDYSWQENRVKLEAAQAVASNPRVTHVISVQVLRVVL